MSSPVLKRALLAISVGFCFTAFSSSALADDAADVSKLLRAGQTDQAMQKVDAVLAQKPRDAQMRFFKGLILTEQGKTNDAIQVFLHLTEDYPELPEPYNNLAVLYASQGEYEKARASLEMAIRTHPSYATAHENLGDVYAKLASQAYDKALQLDSNNQAAQSKLALIRELISVNTNGGKQKPSAATPPVTASVSGTSKAPSLAMNATPRQPATTPLPSAPPPPVAVTPPVAAPVAAPVAPPASVPPPVVKAPPPAAVSPTPTAPPAAASSADQQEVESAVNAWASAWSDKDVDGYLAAYGGSYAPSGQSHEQWAAERRARIVGKSSISVKVEQLEVSVQGDKATARFREDYKAGSLTANSRKTLTLQKVNGKWLIEQERTGA
jgi:tetratricopeptide (TPR) repeat protein